MPRASDRWLPVGFSVLLHGSLVAALIYGGLLFRRPPRPAPTLAIEATVVDARTLSGSQRAAVAPPPVVPVPPPPQAAPPEPQGPPQPSPEERAQREEQRQKAEAAEAAQKAAQEKVAQQAEQAEEARAAEAQRKLSEQKKADEQKKAEAQRKVDEQRKAADARAAQERKAQEANDAQEVAEREAELKHSLASEASAASTGPALASWQAQITARINRAWLRPPTARAGIQCTLYVTQELGGQVTQVKIGDCNGDQAVRESIEAAVYRASPLPPPPDPSLFDRELKINFKPD